MILRILAALAIAAFAADAVATDVTLIGLFPGKTVVTVNRGSPRTLAVGQATPEGVRLVSVDSKGAVFEVDGKRQALEMGQHFESAELTGSRNAVTLPADSRGQFIASGRVNGGHMRFMVDTGATFVSLPAGEARRLGIDYRRGQQGRSMTANGPVVVYRVLLDSVTLGDITLLNVEATVHEMPGMDMGLLGMSFLNRTEMHREGQNLTLTKRY
jgi:aspartyl protease family protein